MVPAVGEDALWDRPRADAARERFEWRRTRLERERSDRAGRLAQRALDAGRSDPDAEKKRAVIQAAIERARAKRAAVTPRNTENLAAEARARIAEVDARRAQIKKAIEDAGRGR